MFHNRIPTDSIFEMDVLVLSCSDFDSSVLGAGHLQLKTLRITGDFLTPIPRLRGNWKYVSPGPDCPHLKNFDPKYGAPGRAGWGCILRITVTKIYIFAIDLRLSKRSDVFFVKWHD